MSKRTRALALAAAALMSLALVAGCSSDKKDSTPTTIDNTGFDIATPNGRASLSLNGTLPEDWPSDFPLPSDAEAAGSGSLGNSSDSGMVAVYTVSGDASETFDFYKQNTAYSVTSSSSGGIGSAFVGTVKFEGAFTGSVTLAGRNSKTYLVIVLTTSTATTTTAAGEATTTTGSGG